MPLDSPRAELGYATDIRTTLFHKLARGLYLTN